MAKLLAWILILVGIYLVLSLLVNAIPAILTGTLGWIVGIVVLVVGLFLLLKKGK